MKFDAISNKTLGVFPEKLWNYFFATVVVKLREELCPKDMQRRREVQEQRQKEWERRNAQRAWEQEEFYNYFWEQNFLFMFSKSQSVKPVNCFKVLGLSEDANDVEVKSAYKKLAVLHHPDKGGKQEKFVEITESKNKCLHWLSSQNVNA